MLALALVMDGQTRTVAAKLSGMDRQILRDWVHRYNEFSVPGLSDRVPTGPQRQLFAAQEAEVAQLVRQGPVLAEHRVVRWSRADLAQVVRARFGVHLAERSVGALLHRLGFRRLSARPRHFGHVEDAQQTHKTFADLVAAAIPEHARGEPVGFWWQDEPRIGQQGTPTRLWAERLAAACATRLPLRLDLHLGCCLPSSSVGAALVLPRANIAAMNLHLAEISARVRSGHTPW